MDTIVGVFSVVWVVFSLPAFVGGLLAARSARARRVARISTGLLMLVGGAVFNATALIAAQDYSGFADAAWSPWVRATWEAVLVPHHGLFIGLLIAYEAAVGVLVLRGGRGARLGLAGVVGFLVALCVFGPGYTVFPVVMLPALLLLLRAERRAAEPAAPAGQPPASVPSP